MKIKPDWRGFYRCPNNCGHPDFPKPKWKTLKGFEKHQGECPMNPPPIPEALPPAPLQVFGNCSSCRSVVFEGETILKRGTNFICWNCIKSAGRVENDFLDCAGLVLGGFKDIVA